MNQLIMKWMTIKVLACLQKSCQTDVIFAKLGPLLSNLEMPGLIPQATCFVNLDRKPDYFLTLDYITLIVNYTSYLWQTQVGQAHHCHFFIGITNSDIRGMRSRAVPFSTLQLTFLLDHANASFDRFGESCWSRYTEKHGDLTSGLHGHCLFRSHYSSCNSQIKSWDNRTIINENEDYQNLMLNYSLEFCQYSVLSCVPIGVEIYFKSCSKN